MPRSKKMLARNGLALSLRYHSTKQPIIQGNHQTSKIFPFVPLLIYEEEERKTKIKNKIKSKEEDKNM